MIVLGGLYNKHLMSRSWIFEDTTIFIRYRYVYIPIIPSVIGTHRELVNSTPVALSLYHDR